MVAGRDTIAVALSWFFWLVATNPGVEDKILEELDRVVITQTGEKEVIFSSIEELNKMVYLHGAISETLRLYPSVPYEPKQSLKDDVLPSGHIVGRNTRVLVSIYSMGRMEDVWGCHEPVDPNNSSCWEKVMLDLIQARVWCLTTSLHAPSNESRLMGLKFALARHTMCLKDNG
ncbi:unnamed protein product [Linum tenue]|nr:unnamed protein product [Linum tenue]